MEQQEKEQEKEQAEKERILPQLVLLQGGAVYVSHCTGSCKSSHVPKSILEYAPYPIVRNYDKWNEFVHMCNTIHTSRSIPQKSKAFDKLSSWTTKYARLCHACRQTVPRYGYRDMDNAQLKQWSDLQEKSLCLKQIKLKRR